MKAKLFINLEVIIILSLVVCDIEQFHLVIPQTYPSSFEFACVFLHPYELIIIVTCWSDFKEYSLLQIPLCKQVLKCHYDENGIFSIEAIFQHKQVACMRRKIMFTIFKYLFLFQGYSSF